MTGIAQRFALIEEKNPYASSFIVFSKTICDQAFTRPVLARWFRKLVDKNDYDSKDMQKLIDWLLEHSKCSSMNGI